MFTSETVQKEKGPPVLKLTAPEKLGGGIGTVVGALMKHVNAERVIIDFSALREVEPGCGIALVMFLQRRESLPVRTRVFGIDADVERANWEGCFQQVNKRERAANYEEALDQVSA